VEILDLQETLKPSLEKKGNDWWISSTTI
jgi:hypothetical protein